MIAMSVAEPSSSGMWVLGVSVHQPVTIDTLIERGVGLFATYLFATHTLSRPDLFAAYTFATCTRSLPDIFATCNFRFPDFLSQNNRYMKEVILIFILYFIYLKIFTKYAYKGYIIYKTR